MRKRIKIQGVQYNLTKRRAVLTQRHDNVIKTSISISLYVYDFLLVGHCDNGFILHRFWDTAIYWLKLAHLPTTLSFGALAPYVPFGILRWS